VVVVDVIVVVDTGMSGCPLERFRISTRTGLYIRRPPPFPRLLYFTICERLVPSILVSGCDTLAFFALPLEECAFVTFGYPWCLRVSGFACVLELGWMG